MAVLGATSLTGCDSIPSFMGTGARTTFRMATTPVSWTKDTTVNTGTLRVVNGTASPGGSVIWDQVFTTRPYTSSVQPATDGCSVGSVTVSVSLWQNFAHPSITGATGLSESQIASHTHDGISNTGTAQLTPGSSPFTGARANTAFGPAGGGGQHTHPTGNGPHNHSVSANSHSHTISGAHDHTGHSGSVDFNLTYVDIIIATKD